MTAPAPIPALPDSERRTAYTIAAQTGPFAVNFAIYGDASDYVDWIDVWLNGAPLSPSAWVLSSPSGSIATLPRPITDAVVTLVVAGTGNLQIVGARRPRRTTEFAENRGVPARDLNQVITDLVAQNRENWDRTRSRMISVPPGETIGQLLPAALRANKVLGFDGAGTLSYGTAAPTVFLNIPLSTDYASGAAAVTAVQGATGGGNIIVPNGATVTPPASFAGITFEYLGPQANMHHFNDGDTDTLVQRLLRSQPISGNHIGKTWGAVGIEARPSGSGGAGNSSDNGLMVSVQKQNWGASALSGQIDGLYLHVQNDGPAAGISNDASAYLFDLIGVNNSGYY